MEPIAGPAMDAPQAVPELATGAAPQGQPDLGVGGQPPAEQQQPPQEQWFIEAPTGTKYRTAEEAMRGIAEKDRLIERFLSGQHNQQPQAAPVQADPQAERNQVIADLTRELEAEYASDPDYSSYSKEDIRAEAKLQAIAAYKMQQRNDARQTKQTQQQAFDAFVHNTPELNTPLAQQVFDRYTAMGIKFSHPQQHLDAVHAEMARQGILAPQPQAGGTYGVAGALGQVQGQNRLFQNPQGGGAPQAQVDSDRVRAAVEEGRKMGFDEPALERVRQRAIENEARFARR